MTRPTYMLDTNICSFIMRERPESVLSRLEHAVTNRHHITISAITYAEMQFGAASPKASPKVAAMVNAFVKRLDSIRPWDAEAVDETVKIRMFLASQGTPISNNDSSIAGHALALNCTLITNNTREFTRVPGLKIEDWA